MTTPVRPPVWFRYGVVALATLMLCSCQAVLPVQQLAVSSVVDEVVEISQYDEIISPPVIPVIYCTDSHTPPPAARRAEYAAGIRSGGCSCQGCSKKKGAGDDCPLVGPRDEYLCDGGDRGLPAGVREDWQIDGLEQEDTIAHYDTVDGRTVITPSNQVCVYAPRFGVVRRVVDLHAYARYDMPTGFEKPLSLARIDENEEAATSLAQLEPTLHRNDNSASTLQERQQLGELDQDVHLAEFDGSLAPYADLQIVRGGAVENGEKALLARASLAAIAWSGDQAPQVTIDSDQAQAAVLDAQPGVVYHTNQPNEPRLRLIKLASAGSARPGEEIEFTLRFDNIGNREMGNVTIVDNLTTRLEYVPDSAKSSLEADFSTEPNSGGSVVLRWEIKQPLAAGEGGILQFKCKVR
ncbi:MAG: DUF11 domain-containing protein [Pirellulales bacterium]|nr:DUF11 domain-containing protein [Pirellulales bacterium]